jgi:valyl-tRNA synthetase
VISTTRPELLPACVGLFYHPEDDRYKQLKGKFAKVPLFDHEVLILADESVQKEKGTGLMMVCTFGDKEDIEKWHKYNLPLRIAITEQGRMNNLAGKYEGKKLKEARQEIMLDMKEQKLLAGQKEIMHAVNVHERCGTEVEFLKKQQWQIKVLNNKEELIEIANQINWYPQHMKVRYEHWVKNLQWNWGISRQRYYGVPFPVWYCQKCGKVLLPAEKELPVDPREMKYKGKCSCGSLEAAAEMDVMDTWMTSSCTPEINADWGAKEERKRFMPMSLRPQAHDIIRTWAFYTIVKSYYHHNKIPWENIMISGHGQDSKGLKMSKSKGNFVVAEEVIEKYSADAFRYWAASVKLGDDLPYQEKDVLTGQKFATKLWNACKFSLPHLEDYSSGNEIKEVFDLWILSKLQRVIKESTESFEKYEYSKSKAEVEKFFWHDFCDQYLEIVKDRLYNPAVRGKEARRSGQEGLYRSLISIIKMMAPIMPHVTEEVYQWYFAEAEGKESVHASSWPEADEKLINEEMEAAGDLGVDVINAIRKYKSEQKMSMKEELEEVVLIGEEKGFEKLMKLMESDIKAVMKVKKVSYSGETSFESEKFKVKVGVGK